MQRPHRQREVLVLFAIGGAGAVCLLPPMRDTRFSAPARSPQSFFQLWGRRQCILYLTALNAKKTTSAALFSNRTAQELKCVRGSKYHPQARPYSTHTTAISYDLLRSYVRLFVAFCYLGQGSSFFLFLAHASLISLTFHVSRLKFEGQRPWAAAEVVRYRVPLSLTACQTKLRRKS